MGFSWERRKNWTGADNEIEHNQTLANAEKDLSWNYNEIEQNWVLVKRERKIVKGTREEKVCGWQQ